MEPDRRLFWAGKTRILYYSNCGQAWGDGMQNLRLLRAARAAYPYAIIDYADHIQTGEATLGMLSYEGIVDSATLLSEHMLNESHEHFRNFTEQRIGMVPYDIVIFGWVTRSPELVLQVLSEFSPNYRFTSIEGSKFIYQMMSGYEAPEAIFPEYYNPSIAAVGLDVRQIIEGLFSEQQTSYLDPRYVAVIPFSSRIHSRIFPHAFDQILNTLLNQNWIPVLIGADRATWVMDVHVRREWQHHAETLQCVARQYPVVDCFGMSAPKQYEILKRCSLAVYSQTGAIILPSLANTCSIPLSCGDTSVITDILRMDQKSIQEVRTTCEHYPCSSLSRWEKCRVLPACLSEEFPIRAFQEALQRVELP